METVKFTDVDSPDEVAKTFNRVIDNQKLMEAKIEQLASDVADLTPKKKKKKGGKQDA